ncbi:MAG: hypothetical protein FWE27_09290 [Defluviitaleaceae bacterium]|nr:hypothetical protein [Defluviitaleaceae bacterium]
MCKKVFIFLIGIFLAACGGPVTESKEYVGENYIYVTEEPEEHYEPEISHEVEEICETNIYEEEPLHDEPEEEFEEEYEPEPELEPEEEYEPEPEEESEPIEQTLISDEYFVAQTVKRFIEIITVQDGAFDIDVLLETAAEAEDSLAQMSLDFNAKMISDSGGKETLLSTSMEMGGWLSGITLPVAVYTLIRSGETVESRIYLGDAELAPETIHTFGLTHYQQIGATDFRRIINEALSQAPEISSELFENFFIIIEQSDEHTYILIQEAVPIVIELPDFITDMLGSGRIFYDKLRIELWIDKNENPERFLILFNSEYCAKTYTSILFTINAIGDAVEITLPQVS